MDKEKLRETQLRDLGPGISLYFKFTKHLILLYLFLTIITIPHVVFYILGGTQEYEDSKTITSFFGLTTLGNLGSAQTMCDSGSSFTSSVSLFCNYGVIDSIEVFGEEKADGSSSCADNGENLKVDSSCEYSAFTTSEKDSLNNAFSTQCKDKEICDFNLSGISFPSACNNKPYIRIG